MATARFARASSAPATCASATTLVASWSCTANATGGRLRGVRQIAAWHRDPAARGSMANPPPGLLLEPAAGRGLAAIERAGLSFDVFAYHTQLGELAEVARRHPGLPMIVNHIGGAIGIGPYAGRRDEVFSDWRAGMIELGRCAECPRQAERARHAGVRLRVRGSPAAALLVRPRDGMGTLHRGVHRDLRRRPLHVRQQLPRRQGNVQLSRAVERVQADRRRRVRAREAGAVRRHGQRRLSPGRRTTGAMLQAQERGR